MKKLGLLILGFIIGALLTYYFCPRPETAEDMEDEVELVKPPGVITVAQAKVLNNNWTKFRKGAVDSASARQGRPIDKRSVGWSVKDIRDYLNWAEAKSDTAGFTMDSIRVYLGVFGNKSPKKKADFTTMFIAPVGQKKTAEAAMEPISSFIFQNNGIPPLNGGTGGGGYGND